ncbi:hypothetical protein T492DRAFT_931117 [Pavlovales sp. CCMP2436]|nr:hypothetical protein T492DRAFT_931117 [Pavlovales sp. CCMP2436]
MAVWVAGCLLALGGAQARWLQTSASKVIRAPVGQTYAAWRDLKRMPEWSPVSRVDVDPTSGDSQWHLGYHAIEVSWKAQVVTDEYPSLLRWESTLGVPNRGEVRFTADGRDGCTMALTMSYQIPERISRIVESGIVQTFILRTCLRPTMQQFCEAMEREAGGLIVDQAAPTDAQITETLRR